MITRLLIANRGEIACRIISTAKAMGIHTIALASDPDENARHTRLADEVVRIGGDSAASSYLDQAKVINAARSSGAEAIHPGYGFLSENPDFVEAVEKAGLIFIGPSADAIRAMGLKDKAKQLMAKAGVPVVPGYDGDDQNPDTLKAEASAIGYPVMIKARAGGGGKGMRRVDNADDFGDALNATKREAAASFGDDHVLIEKCITAPRHIEVQIFADNHGEVVHLFERDCTLQRRHQKVIEEAPAPGMNDSTRKAMTDAAIAAARAIDYRGAGTIEFIVDGQNGLRPDGFWFMEMNTRLQVEHPVTEMITGFDLVEWQIKIANGDPLPVEQDDIRICGHAVEARIYAEDALNGFRPAPGIITKAQFPNQIRVDHGVNETDRISPYYDPMIAKVIASGADRNAAFAQMKDGLSQTHLMGTTTNTGFLSALASHPDVEKMAIDTTWIDRHLLALQDAMQPSDHDLALISLAHLSADHGLGETHGWRAWGDGSSLVKFRLSDALIERRVVMKPDRQATILGGERPYDMAVASASATHLQVIEQGQSMAIEICDHHGQISIDLGARNFRIDRFDPLAINSDAASGTTITAPMTGVVTVLETALDQEVKMGDILIRMEAMKMEHAMPAPCHGRVVAIHCTVGDAVEDGRLLISLEADET